MVEYSSGHLFPTGKFFFDNFKNLLMQQILLVGPNVVDSAERHKFISSEGFLVPICTKSSNVISNESEKLSTAYHKISLL